MTADAPILLGQVLKAHGLKGEVKVKSFTAEPLALGAYGPVTTETGRRLVFERLRPGPGALLARFEGIGDRDAAEGIEGAKLYVARAQLPNPADSEYYHADLIGLTAIGPEGQEIGRVAAVHDFGAGDLIEIACADGAPLLLPFTDDCVPEVDLAAGRLVVVPLAEAAP